MNKRPLGNTGIEVSELAFGAVEIGMPYGIGVTAKDDMPTEAEAIRLLHAALASGINFIDTARQYGESEAIIGKAFKGKRSSIVIATKCKHLANGSKIDIIDSIKESLAALQTDYIDVYMLHDSNPGIIQHPEVLNCFYKLKKEGIIRAAGISTYTPDETEAVIESGVWDVIQVPFNLLDQRQEPLIKMANERGIGIVVRSVLMKGLLTNRKQKLHAALASVEEHIGHLDELAGQFQLTLPTLATRFALSYKEVSSVLVGLDRMEYLHQSLQAANGQNLSGPELQLARAMAYPEPDFLNLHHWHTKGWLV